MIRRWSALGNIHYYMYTYRIELSHAHNHFSISAWKLTLTNKRASSFWKQAVLYIVVMAFRMFCCVCHLILGVCNKFLPGYPHEGAAIMNCGETIATTTKAVKYRRNSSAAFVFFEHIYCSLLTLRPLSFSCVFLWSQTQYQRSWLNLYTGISTTRSTWSLRWPACSSLQSSTAGLGAWSSAVMLSNLYSDTMLSSRPWPRKACTSLTRTGWWLRGIWPARLYTWWADAYIYTTQSSLSFTFSLIGVSQSGDWSIGPLVYGQRSQGLCSPWYCQICSCCFCPHFNIRYRFQIYHNHSFGLCVRTFWGGALSFS